MKVIVCHCEERSDVAISMILDVTLIKTLYIVVRIEPLYDRNEKCIILSGMSHF